MTMRFSLMFFASDGADCRAGVYDYLLEACQTADQIGLEAVWLPERHFHRFGGLFPNPAIVAAALAAVTNRIRIRAGSIIIPLNDPLRVAEEWAVVDNLSGGRVDLGFGQGWNPNDFVLMPDSFHDRHARLHAGIETVSALWAGSSLCRHNGLGAETEVFTFPRPVQPAFGLWLTCSGAAARFEEAGAMGANVLTALLFQDISELKGKIEIYRKAWMDAGHQGAGKVSLMLHTYVGSSTEDVRGAVREPLLQYLRDSTDLWKQQYPAFDELGEVDRKRVIEFAFEKYVRFNSLCGTQEECIRRAEALAAIGVDEIACLVDFGVDAMIALPGIARIGEVQDHLSEQTLMTHQDRELTC